MNSYPFALSGRRIEAQDQEQLLQTSRRLLTEIQALSSRIAAVNEIANAINRSLNLDEILRVVGKQAKWLLDFKHCSVCLYGYDGSCRLITLFGPPVACSSCLFPGDNPISRALKTGQPQLNPKDYTSTFLDAYTSQIIIPSKVKNKSLVRSTLPRRLQPSTLMKIYASATYWLCKYLLRSGTPSTLRR
jgi:GAF domain-containing protein